jgi:ribonuclease R
MQLAEYSHLHKGHFGLGSEAYTHFTSPIRRYPDLIVHRLLKDQAGMLRLGKKTKQDLVGHLPALTKECSRLERQAEQAEREAIRLKKAHFLSERLGETFKGTITGVAKFGIFVELEAILAEVLVHVSKLGNEYFHHDEERREMVGAETGRTFRLGDTLHVRVGEVNLRERRVLAELAEAPGSERLRRARDKQERKTKSERPERPARVPGKSRDKSSGPGEGRSGRRRRKR